jgi:8-oxo-dGTP pyrophosphatase MutT (NUDIX family)
VTATDPVPPQVLARARDVASGRVPAAELAPAATVVLLHAAADGAVDGEFDGAVEVYLQRRHQRMAFAPGMAVFPGGRVEPDDGLGAVGGWAGPSPQQVADWFAASATTAAAHVVAVVRELAEETGLLLVDEPRVLAADEDPAPALRAGTVRADLLLPWARWVTPRFERRRYDTWFFACVLPPGVPAAAIQDRSGEADSAQWWTPSAALAAVGAGTLAMLPPTRAVLHGLVPLRDTAALAAHAPATDGAAIRRIAPGIHVAPNGSATFVLPGDPRWPGLDPQEGQ